MKESLDTKNGINDDSFPVVGIGASAGGLAAFEAFFSGMPENCEPGMAFVLVQHLAPDHKSILTELVKRYTRMEVFEVEDGMRVKPNCVYIIPPDRDMAFLDGALQLMDPAEPRGRRLPIDFFFRSLARDQHERAICITLSGTGSDGAMGVRAVKGEGGMAMAQTAESTEYDGMPRSAISTGLVDYVLPPAEMPAQLMKYVSRAFAGRRKEIPEPDRLSENAFKKIFFLLRSQTGHDFSLYKQNTIVRRIERRMAVQQVENVSEYARFLQQNSSEVDALFRDMLIGVTNFFRDVDAFGSLAENAVAKIFDEKAPGAAVRVWSAGCSTGEEAYSLAILLFERMEKIRRQHKTQVFATDIDPAAIEHARAGRYPDNIAADVSPERLDRFFVREPGGGYRISKSIRDMLVFSEQDIIMDPPFSRLDMISCRNMLIYMGGDLQKKIIPLFHYALNPGGFLFLGTSETIGEHPDLFDTVDRKSKLYKRKAGSNAANRQYSVKVISPLSDSIERKPASSKTVEAAKTPFREIMEQTMLREMPPSGALINSRGDILYLHGRTGKYLEPSSGDAAMNILLMAREGLKRDITTALHRVVAQKEMVVVKNLRVKTNGDYTLINLILRPVVKSSTNSDSPDLFIALFQEVTGENATSAPAALDKAADGGSSKSAGGRSGKKTDARVAELEKELSSKNEYLQATIEELETANEELKSSNEELQSTNEELQSTNEELETSKEELQSVNEELSTVNAELQQKVADLSRVNNDMNNLLAGTGIGTIFVDHQLRIQRFTPTITEVINLIQSDVGRPVGHIVSNLAGYDSLVEDVRAVLDNLVPVETDVQTKAGQWYQLRIRPYRTLENVIEGAVIAFVDITGRKKME